jgi:hypothetical protein
LVAAVNVSPWPAVSDSTIFSTPPWSTKPILPASCGFRAIWSFRRVAMVAVVSPAVKGAVVMEARRVWSAVAKFTVMVLPVANPAGAAGATKKLSRLAAIEPVTAPEKVTSTETGGAGVAAPMVPAVRPEPVNASEEYSNNGLPATPATSRPEANCSLTASARVPANWLSWAR